MTYRSMPCRRLDAALLHNHPLWQPPPALLMRSVRPFFLRRSLGPLDPEGYCETSVRANRKNHPIRRLLSFFEQVELYLCLLLGQALLMLTVGPLRLLIRSFRLCYRIHFLVPLGTPGPSAFSYRGSNSKTVCCSLRANSTLKPPCRGGAAAAIFCRLLPNL